MEWVSALREPLHPAGAHVIMAVRNTDLGARRATEIGGSTSVVALDLADLSSVRRFCEALDDDVDILINNAGTLTQNRVDTVDGFEMTLGTNLSGAVRFDELLFGRVRSKIINVGSEAHKGATLRLDDMHLRTHRWTVLGAYDAVEARGDVVGSRAGPQTEGGQFARHHPPHTSGLRGVEPVASLRPPAHGR